MTEKTIKQNKPVAIIGIGCFFPKSSGLKDYWRLLLHGEDAITEIPETHWSPEDYFDENPKRPDHVQCKRGGFLSPVSFDPSEFGIPPSSLEATDTSQLLGLVAAKIALRDARYGDENVNHHKTSVILGATGTQELVIPLGARLGFPKWRKALEASGVSPEKTDEVLERISESYVSWQENSFPGLLGNVIAGRICNRLNLGGTNCAVDAACASSLGALHLGLMELENDRADMIVTGGVDALNDIFMHMCFSKSHVLSPTSDARPFSKDADGTVLGEGIGIVILKRLEDAERDGDRIYAVIKGIGTSSDGKAQSIYSPNAEGQIRSLRAAYENANVPPQTVELIEAHGTGTRVGDAVEFQALKSVFGEQDTEKIDSCQKWCAIGSVKSMIGHTKAAAGAAGLIKGVLSLYHKVFPPTLKISEPDPNLDIQNSPFYLNTETRPWFSRKEHPRRCSVSAFGFGGSNFHMVLEEYKKKKQDIAWDGSVEIVAFSAPNQETLKERLISFKNDVGSSLRLEPTVGVQGLLAQKAAATRETFSTDDPYRLLLVLEYPWDATIFDTALETLDAKKDENIWNVKNIFYGTHEKPGKIAFIFPGQGSQYVNMGRDLICLFPEAFDILEKANEQFKTHHSQSNDSQQRLSDLIYPYPVLTKPEKEIQEESLRSTNIAQPAIGAISMAMLKILTDFGLTPDATCGHSFGELSALYSAGRIDLDTFFYLAVSRGKFMALSGKEKGTMMAVKASLEEIDQLIADEKLDVILANRNSPNQGVLSGSVEAIDQAEKVCKKKKIRATKLAVAAAFHSRLVKDAQQPFMQTLEKVNMSPSEIPVFSNTTAEAYPSDAESAKQVLGGQILCPVNFVKEIENLFDMGVRTFVEVGPKSVLTGLVKAILKGRDFQAISLDDSAGKKFGVADFAKTLSHLASLGYPVRLKDWEDPGPEPEKQRMSIPICGANYRSPNSAKSGKPNKETVSEKKKMKKVSASSAVCSPSLSESPECKDYNFCTSSSHRKTSEPNLIKKGKISEVFSAEANLQRAYEVPVYKDSTILSFQNEYQEDNNKKKRVNNKSDKIMGRNIISTMDKDNQRQTVPSQSPAYPVTDALNVVQEGLKSMQALQMHTTEAHKKFLETQSEANRTLREMMESTRHLAEVSMGGRREYRIQEPEYSSQNIGAMSPESGVRNQESEAESRKQEAGSQKSEVRSQKPELRNQKPEAGYQESACKKEIEVGIQQPIANRQSPTANRQQPTANDSQILDSKLLDVVSELTGYPLEMLSLDMDIESDLGIDSIKRVEILSTLEEKMPGLPAVSPEIMGTLKTLRQIAEYLGTQESSGVQGSLATANSQQPTTNSPHILDSQLLEVVSELTGYPLEMLSLDMDIESDLGIDSIKRVEILSTLEEKMPGLPAVSPEIMGTLKTLRQIAEYLGTQDSGVRTQESGLRSQDSAPSTQKPAANNQQLTANKLLEVVSELTGYPIEMLSLDMDIESDLGIDSIKRVEILSTLEEKMPGLPAVSPEIMGTLKTLRQIAEYLGSQEPGVQGSLASGVQGSLATANNQLPERRIVSVVESPFEKQQQITIPAGRTIFVTDDETGLSKAIVDEFNAIQIDAMLIQVSDLVQVSDTELFQVSDLKQQPPAAGLVIVPNNDFHISDVKEAFAMTRQIAPEILDSAKQGGALFAAITRMDGAFGFAGSSQRLEPTGIRNPFQGSLAGLVKTASIEWKEVCCHAIDISLDWKENKAIAKRVVAELIQPGSVEIGLKPDSRYILSLEDSSYPQGKTDLNAGDVVVITGGARGVTAAAACALCNEVPRLTLVLLGRSPHPTPEPEWLVPLDNDAAIKKAILENELSGHASPVELEKSFKKHMANREISKNLERLKSTGATVLYHSSDIRDAERVNSILDDVRAIHGPVKGIIHGAGILKDRFIIDKTPEQFEKVFDTKVIGLMNLLEATTQDPLRYLVFFSSIAARMGNKGQADYAMANEILNKMAHQESASRPDCKVVSINWGPWDGGMVSPALKREFERNGIELIPMEPGAACMLHEMAGNKDQPAEVVIGAGLTDAKVENQQPTANSSQNHLTLSFKREIEIEKYPILKSYMLKGKPVVPFALITEWLGHGALHENPGLFLHGFDEMRLLNEITVNGEKKLIHLLAGKAKKNGMLFEVDIEIRDGIQDDMGFIHSRAKAILGNSLSEPPAFNKPDNMTSAYSKDMKEVYEKILFQGIALHGIKEILSFSSDLVAARIASAPSPDKWIDEPLRTRWIGDPLVLDSAFQMASLCSFEKSGKISLPDYCASYRQYCNTFPSEGVTAIFEVKDADGDKIKGDFTFLDAKDTVIARLTGYEAVTA